MTKNEITRVPYDFFLALSPLVLKIIIVLKLSFQFPKDKNPLYQHFSIRSDCMYLLLLLSKN